MLLPMASWLLLLLRILLMFLLLPPPLHAADAAAAAAELPCARQPKKAHAAVFAVAVRVTVHHDQEHALQRVDCAQN